MVIQLKRSRKTSRKIPFTGNHNAIVVSVIEADVGQFIGALMLWRSLRQSLTPVIFRLCIVNRETDASGLLETCRVLGLEATGANPHHLNPFLNKWLALDAFTSLVEAPHLLLLDWDTVLCTPCTFPGPFKAAIAARRNPPGMYSDILNGAATPLPRTPAIRWGRVRSSINGGVLIGSGKNLSVCAQKTIAWVAEITKRVPAAPAWKVEQLALSMAVGEVGLTALDNRWNVTPQFESKVNDSDVHLWHYNDGVEASYALKRCLCRPAQVQVQLLQLSVRWPRSAALFSRLYEEVIGMDPVARILPRYP